MDDGDLQAQYSFSDTGAENHWLNLFEDRRERIAAIGDAETREWIGQDNYSELAARLGCRIRELHLDWSGATACRMHPVSAR